MRFSKRSIAEFKSRGMLYIFEQTEFSPENILQTFYAPYAQKNLEKWCFCHSFVYKIANGTYTEGARHITKNGNYYMFWGAKNINEPAHCLTIGMAVKGNLYMIKEDLNQTGYDITFLIVPENIIDNARDDVNPELYMHSINFSPRNKKNDDYGLTDEDVKCIRIAYKGVKAFSKLIKELN